jgi:hypothetical protein
MESQITMKNIAMIGFDISGLIAGASFLLAHANAIYLLYGAASFAVSAIIKIIDHNKKKTPNQP